MNKYWLRVLDVNRVPKQSLKSGNTHYQVNSAITWSATFDLINWFLQSFTLGVDRDTYIKILFHSLGDSKIQHMKNQHFLKHAKIKINVSSIQVYPNQIYRLINIGCALEVLQVAVGLETWNLVCYYNR